MICWIPWKGLLNLCRDSLHSLRIDYIYQFHQTYCNFRSVSDKAMSDLQRPIRLTTTCGGLSIVSRVMMHRKALWNVPQFCWNVPSVIKKTQQQLSDVHRTQAESSHNQLYLFYSKKIVAHCPTFWSHTFFSLLFFTKHLTTLQSCVKTRFSSFPSCMPVKSFRIHVEAPITWNGVAQLKNRCFLQSWCNETGLSVNLTAR